MAKPIKSIAEAERAQTLDPLSLQVLGPRGYAYLLARRYDESIARFQKALDLYPDTPWLRAGLALAYARKGSNAQAISEFDKIAVRDKAVTPDNQFVAFALG